MAIFDRIRSQLRSVIEWENPDQNEIFSLWSERGDEIKNCSKLIVKPGQGAVFVYEGRVEAIHLEEGLYELKTANIPFWTTMTKFMQAFESEHKVGIYFFWQTQFLNQKWGTSTPIKYDDPVYKFPVGLRAFGNFTFRIVRPEFFFANFVGSRSSYRLEEMRRAMSDRFMQPLTDLLAEAGHSYAEIDKNRDELAAALTDKVKPEFDKLGLEMTDFRIESTNFDDETQTRIARIADVTAEAEAAKRAGINYAQMQQLQALRDAAKNEGGLAGAGVGIGAGFGLGQSMTASMAGIAGAGSAPGAENDAPARLKKLKDLLDQGLITREEYEGKKAEILQKL